MTIFWPAETIEPASVRMTPAFGSRTIMSRMRPARARSRAEKAVSAIMSTRGTTSTFLMSR